MDWNMTSAGNLILAALITPAMAYAGLAAAALPVLIHLFNRRRFRRIRWAATEFLLEAERRNRRRTRLEEYILLALRCLAMALIGLALARWFVPPRSLVASLGSSARTDHIILVDDSYSMGASRQGPADIAALQPASGMEAPDGTRRTVFDEARSATQKLVEHIRQVAPDDSITLLLTSRPDHPVRHASAAAQVPPQAWSDDIKGMQLSARAGNLPAAMKRVRSLLDARQSTLRAAVYVVSDFQAVDWLGADQGVPSAASEQSSAGAAPRGPAADLAGWADGQGALEMVLVDVGSNFTANSAIAAIIPEQAQAVLGVVGRYKARVENFGSEQVKPGELHVFMGDTALPPVVVPALAPNQSVDVPVELAFGQEGSQRLTVQLGPDVLPADNLRSLAVPVERALRLLLVNGEASPDPYEDEAFLLNVALRPEGPEFSGNETVIINEDEFEVADLNDYHAVVLMNVNRVTQEMAARLEQFASAGGGVLFFLGDQVDSTAYNRLLHRNGQGILPARLGEQVSAPADRPGYGLAPTEGEDGSAFKLGGAAAPLLGDALVWQYFTSDFSAESAPADNGAAPSGSASSAPRSAASTPRVLLRLNDPEHTPLLVERRFGGGRVLMFSTSADKEWNNLPDQPVYVVLMMELMQYAARPSATGGDQFVGEPIRLVVDQAAYEPMALLRLPTYPSTPAVRLEARPQADTGQTVVEWTDTGRPGLYEFELRTTSGDTITRQVAVNLEPRESDLRRAERTALLASMGNLPASYVTADSLAERAQAEARHELWPAIVALLAAVLIIEQGLAWWFGADRSWQRAVRWTAS